MLIRREKILYLLYMRIEWLFIWTNLNPLHPRMHCAKFGWNWPSGSGEEEFFNFVNVFSLFHNHLPLEPLIWTNLNPLHQSLVEIGPVVLEKSMKMWKVYDNANNIDRQGQILIRKAHLSLRLRWDKKNEITSDNHKLLGMKCWRF